MAIEGATHINDLDVAKPSGATEQVLDLDNYHRQIKEVLKRDVNNFAGTALVYGADAASTDDYAFSSALTITTYTAGIICLLDLTGGNTNTGAARLNIDGIGLKAIVGLTGAALAAGALQIGINLLVYNGTSFVLGASPIVDINGGAIDGAIIGANDAAAITGTTITGTAIAGTVITASTDLTLATGATVTGIDNGTLGSSATLLATQGAVKTYVDALITAGSGGAAERALNSAGVTSVNHGFAALPQLVTVVLECTTNDIGYTPGDQVNIGVRLEAGAAGPNSGIAGYADATQVHAAVDPGSGFYLPNATTGVTGTALTTSRWKVVATAYKFA